MILRLIASLFSLWAIGFVAFALTLPGPAGSEKTDAIVVPTGGKGRIDRGLEVLRAGEARQLLVTGVDPEVKPAEFAAEYTVEEDLMKCCITLGQAAEDTKGNAAETAEWIARRDYKSLRLVTTNWHMRRASLELASSLPADVRIVEDATSSTPSLRILVLEYHKLIASFLSQHLPV
ncbi:MAG TPA: YdcF family protein [Sphingomonadaceae bacterium]|nr:YdcF family protein [Sphingomonadaceae bacterium]